MFDEGEARKIATRWLEDNLPRAAFVDRPRQVNFAGREMWRFELWLSIELPGHGPIGPIRDIWVDVLDETVVLPDQEDVPALATQISAIVNHPFANGKADNVPDHLHHDFLQEIEQESIQELVEAHTIHQWANSVFRVTDAHRFPALMSDIYQCLGLEPVPESQAAILWKLVAVLATCDIRKLQTALGRRESTRR